MRVIRNHADPITKGVAADHRSKRFETEPRLRITREGTMVTIIWRTTLLLGIVGLAAILVGCEEVVPEPKKAPVVRPAEPEPTEPEVHVLSRSQLENDVLTVTGNSLSFAQPVSYGKGDFITAELSARTPYGMLREVTTVSSDRQTVTTSDASLEDVLTEGTVTISGTLTPNDLTPASKAALAESGLVARGGGAWARPWQESFASATTCPRPREAPR